MNIIFALILSIVFCSNAMALQIGSANNASEDEIGNLNTFLNSDFVRTSVWPGIGPFQSTANNRLIDPTGNQLTYSTSGKQISSCQLEMRGGTNEAQCMLSLQMSTDFLLESLGAKPAQIHVVNSELSKNSKSLMGNNYNPVHTTVAPFIVSLQNLGINEGTENSIYRIVIANQNLSSGDLEISKNKEDKNLSVENTQQNMEVVVAPPSTPAPASTSSQRVIKNNQAIRTSPEIKTSGVNDHKMETVVNVQETSVAENSKQESSKTTKPLTKDEQLKNEFRDVIQNWQNLKKTAVKERDSKLLSQALAGKALIRQTDAIKWLANNHKYYDMTPGGAKIEKITPLVSGKKYTVFAEVKEKTKYVEEASGQVIKETDDTYKVNYTIEKISDKWLISDSALVKTTEKTTDKAGAPKNAQAKTTATKPTKPGNKNTH